MLEELPLFRMAAGMARHASARHQVIARNVANADTPEFRARDVKPFAEYVNDPFMARATRPGHEGFQPLARAGNSPEVLEDAQTSTSGNGNTVSLETEMIKAAEAKGQHAMAMAIYRKAHDFLRLGLGRGR